MKKPIRRLELIAEYGQQAQNFLCNKSLEEWRTDMQLRYAVAHALAGVVENIKEYARDSEKLSELERRTPHVPWNMIIRFRDKMTHYNATTLAALSDMEQSKGKGIRGKNIRSVLDDLKSTDTRTTE